jgi:hypothetical protein
MKPGTTGRVLKMDIQKLSNDIGKTKLFPEKYQ